VEKDFQEKYLCKAQHAPLNQPSITLKIELVRGLLITMSDDRCNIDVNPHNKKGWEVVFRGDCDKRLNDINQNLGQYGRRYWDDHHIYEKQPIKPQLSQTEVPKNPSTADSTNSTE
jgi:hypothetical protein